MSAIHEDLEARRIARGPSRVSESAGPTPEQFEGYERVVADHYHVYPLDWHPWSGNAYVTAKGADGRVEALYRIEEDGRVVTERTWA